MVLGWWVTRTGAELSLGWHFFWRHTSNSFTGLRSSFKVLFQKTEGRNFYSIFLLHLSTSLQLGDIIRGCIVKRFHETSSATFFPIIAIGTIFSWKKTTYFIELNNRRIVFKKCFKTVAIKKIFFKFRENIIGKLMTGDKISIGEKY